MLEVLVYLLLQLGLAGDLSTQQQIVTDPATSAAEGALQLEAAPTEGDIIITTTEDGIGGSGWDDKN